MSRSSTAKGRHHDLVDAMSILARVSRELGPATDLDRAVATAFTAMAKLVPFEGAALALLDGDQIVLRDADPSAVDAESFRTSARHGIVSEVIASGQSAVSGDLRTDPRTTPEFRPFTIRRGIVSYLCAPMTCLGEVIGALLVYSGETDAFGDEDTVLLEGLAAQVAGAIESARRYKVVTELEALKADFIARVSHELRTPITIVSGFVTTLLTNHDRLDHDTRRRMLERVDVATARLSGLIDQLLMLTRLEAGVVAVAPEPVSIADLLEEVRRQAAMPGAVAVACEPGTTVVTDRSLVLRALAFLVDNALKYAGRCRIEATGRVIEVIDDGPGIAPGERSRMFEQFTRASEDTTVAGMGIGLPMARTLLAVSGADLTIDEPADGCGTRMVVRFR